MENKIAWRRSNVLRQGVDSSIGSLIERDPREAGGLTFACLLEGSYVLRF